MHPVAWFAWIGLAALVPLLTRNPLYLVVVLVITYVVADAVRVEEPQGSTAVLISPVRFALFAVPAGAIFNGLTSHVGETVLVHLPDAVPLLGGALTVESLVYGAINGLVLATLFSAFAVLNLAVPVRDLIGYLPRAFYPIAVVSAIAVTFVPNSLRQFRQVREAQAIRGHRMRGLRDWLPLFMPVLIGGMERALQLAEAMTARGFAADSAPMSPDQVPATHADGLGDGSRGRPMGRSLVPQIALVGGLGSVFVGSVLRLMPQWSPWSLPLLLLGTVLTGWAIWRAGSHVRHTRYRQPVWRVGDALVIVAGVAAVVSLLVWSRPAEYTPYPLLTSPTFDVRVGVALLGFLAPAPIAPRRERERTFMPNGAIGMAGTIGMITLDRVSFRYPDAPLPALSDVSLTVSEGAFALVAGPSGAGKSTLLRCLNGLVPHFTGGTFSGRVVVDGLEPVAVGPQTMCQHVGFVFQDPEAQFVMDRVEDEIAFALENAAMGLREMQSRVGEVLELLDLTALRRRTLATLSGGEKQRVAIAAALALRPRVLVLDEPTSQLDPQSAEDVLTAIARLNAEIGLTIVLAEHRLERVLSFADRFIFVPGGLAPVLSGNPREILGRIDLAPPVSRLAKALGWSPLPVTLEEAEPFTRTVTWPSVVGAGETFVPTSEPSAAHMVAESLDVSYDGVRVLSDVSLTLARGEVTVLMGRNGAGKSTLLKSLVGLVRPERGRVRLDGRDITASPVAEICREVAYLPQDPNALLFADTVLEELHITLRNHGISAADAPVVTDALLAGLGLADKVDAYPRDLSVGERQRVALAAIMVTGPGVVLLDEPTRGLDYEAKARLVDLIRMWRADNLAILLVTHDVELAAAAADRVVLMEVGRIVAQGSPRAVLGRSALFAPQIARLFPGCGWLTVEDALEGLRP